MPWNASAANISSLDYEYSLEKKKANNKQKAIQQRDQRKLGVSADPLGMGYLFWTKLGLKIPRAQVLLHFLLGGLE